MTYTGKLPIHGIEIGEQRVDPSDQKMYRWNGTTWIALDAVVPSSANLPMTGNTEGDIREDIVSGRKFIWIGGEWILVAEETGGMSFTDENQDQKPDVANSAEAIRNVVISATAPTAKKYLKTSSPTAAAFGDVTALLGVEFDPDQASNPNYRGMNTYIKYVQRYDSELQTSVPVFQLVQNPLDPQFAFIGEMQVKTLHTTPVVISPMQIPNPGYGIDPVSLVVKVQVPNGQSGVAYTGDTDLVITYGNESDAPVIATITGALAVTATTIHKVDISNITIKDGKQLYIRTATSDPVTGNMAVWTNLVSTLV